MFKQSKGDVSAMQNGQYSGALGGGFNNEWCEKKRDKNEINLWIFIIIIIFCCILIRNTAHRRTEEKI